MVNQHATASFLENVFLWKKSQLNSTARGVDLHMGTSPLPRAINAWLCGTSTG